MTIVWLKIALKLFLENYYKNPRWPPHENIIFHDFHVLWYVLFKGIELLAI